MYKPTDIAWHESQSSSNNNKNFNSAYSRDRAHIIHSASFRRLQSKTQVLGLGDSDFYRTRLTHSLEVAQIGSGICESLKQKTTLNAEIKEWIPEQNLIEAICLAHDIGHPAFGHGGEIALNYCMQSQGGFEGNGQTLRIVTKLGEFDPRYGLDLTRRTMLGLLKYPATYENVINKNIPSLTINGSSTLNLDAFKPPKCILSSETEELNWILSSFNQNDQQLFQQVIHNNEEKHYKTKYKAFDTSIMELADDIAYGIHDLEDAIALKLITEDLWNDKVLYQLENLIDSDQKSLDILNVSSCKELSQLLFKKDKNSRKHAISKLVRLFIHDIKIIERAEFSHPLLKLQAVHPSNLIKALQLLKDFVYEVVIQSPEVQLVEYKGQKLILELFEILKANPKRLLPKNIYDHYEQDKNPDRIICDYISGMTDEYANKTYQKLCIPSVGSVFDRL